MIYSNTTVSSDLIAKHYDELDELYRQIWGEHVHHGWFLTGDETKAEATKRLSIEVANLSEIAQGHSVCDIGCGYGATSSLLAKEYKAQVLGLTISPAQFSIAQSKVEDGKLQFRLLNWLENDLPDSSFDHLIAIESSEHMPDKIKFFSEAQRVLKRGGSFVVCAWLSSENPKSWERRHLLEPICREGRLPSMGSESEYRSFLSSHDMEIQSFIDISRLVKKTWTLSLLSLASYFSNHPSDLKLLFTKWNSNAEFLKTLFRIRIAYAIGSMRYGIFKAVKL